MAYKKLNIVYYHGYNSYLPQARRYVLEQAGTVRAPDIDYFNFPSIDVFLNTHAGPDVNNTDVFVGVSMGGLVAYHAAVRYNLPCLLFNPAFYFNGFPVIPLTEYTNHKVVRTSLSYIVSGRKDYVIDFNVNQKFIQEHIIEPKMLFTEPTMEHLIPHEIFKSHFESFYHLINGN